MAQLAEFTLLADVAGQAMNPVPDPGTEIANKASRRILDFTDYGYARVNWATSTVDANLKCRVEYSQDQGQTWKELIPPCNSGAAQHDSVCSDWAPIPVDITGDPSQGLPPNAINIMVRAMILDGGGSTRVTYVSLQVR